MSQPDHFSLLNFEPRFALDLAALESAFKRVQAQVHPDRFAVASAAEKRVAMQWAARANEAYRVLRDPIARAAYLCEMNGVPINAESNTAMPADFLMQQMQWREELDEAEHDEGARLRLQAEVGEEQQRLLAELQRKLDVDGDHPAAAALVRRLMFTDKFSREVAHATQLAEQRGAA